MKNIQKILASVVTAAWIVLGAVLLITLGFSGEGVKLNELGDFLAGFFAPLAFFWLVLGYYQQQQELRLNTEQLALQREEMAKMSEEATRQSLVMTETLNLNREEAEKRSLEFERSVVPVLEVVKSEARPYRGDGSNSMVVSVKNKGAEFAFIHSTTHGFLHEVSLDRGYKVLKDEVFEITVRNYSSDGLREHPVSIVFEDRLGRKGSFSVSNIAGGVRPAVEYQD